MHTSENVKIHGAYVLFGFLLFFPVGIVLLIIRYVLHAKQNHLRDKDYRLTGHALLILFGLIMLIVMLSDSTVQNFVSLFVALFILFGIPAIVFYAAASSWEKKTDARYKMYRLAIEQGNDSIAALSQLTGVSTKNVQEDIRYMIVTDQLPNASITASGDIVLPDRTTKTGPQGNGFAAAQTAAAEQASYADAPKSVVCSGCGATVNLYPGKSPECEFCGTVLNDR